MEKGEWIWGRELLRDSMKHLAEAAGLEAVEEQYIGKHFSYDQLAYVNLVAKYQDIDQQLFPREQNYLIALIARPKDREASVNYEKTIEDVLRTESKIETNTYYFDFSSVNFRLQENRNKIEELQNTTTELKLQLEGDNKKIKELQNANANLKSQLEGKDLKINELHGLNADFKSQLEGKDLKINELRGLNTDFKSQLEDKDLEASELQESNADLTSKLEDKTNEILDLKETLNQRENSLSWRFSQHYGRYFSIDSPVTKVTSSILKTMIKFKEPKSHSVSKNDKDLHKHELNNILEEHKGKIKGIIIYPPTVDWNIPLFQRPQQVALQLSKMGYLFFFSTGSNKLDHVEGFQQIEDRCYITNQYDLLTNELPEFILLFSSTNLVVNLSGIQKIRTKAFIIYEYIDEISEEISGTSIDNIIRRHKYLIKHSDVILATADKLLENIIQIRKKDVYLNPNGVEYEHFHIIRDAGNIPSEMRTIVKKGNPIIGYYGALAKWFDYKLIKELAEKRPNYEIVLIGWDYDNSMKDQELKNYKNIHYLGVKKYPVLPKYAIWFDVATIPFVLNKITESTSPIKIFEYMALGMPIVTSDMRECRKYRSILIGKSYDEFIQKIDEGLELRKDKLHLGLLDKEAKENTWESRARQIDEIIQKKIGTINKG
jgi:teichuronic acid biosynthesis glycosyltransferase TuaH